MAENSTSKAPLRDFWRVLFRRWRLLALVAALFAFASLLAAQRVPKKYTAKAIFEIRPDPAVSGQRDGDAVDQLMRTVHHDVAGPIAVEKAVAALELDRGLSHGEDGLLDVEGKMARQRLVEDLVGRLNFRVEVSSSEVNRLSLSFTDDDPELVARLPNRLVNDYVDSKYQLIGQQLLASKTELKRYVDDAKQRLQDKTRERIEFERLHAEELPEAVAELRRRYSQLNEEIESLRGEVTVEQERKASLERHASSEASEPNAAPTQTIVGPNPRVAELGAQLRAAREQREQMMKLGGMKPEHPDIKQMDVRIEMLEKTLEAEPEEVVVQKIYGTDRDTLLVELATSRSRVRELGRLLELRDRERQSIQTILSGAARTRHEHEALRAAERELDQEVKKWQTRLDEVEMKLKLELAKRATHLEIIELAREQYVPSDPQLSKVLLFSFGGGIALGLGLVMLGNFLDRTFTTSEDVATHLSKPVYGVIGEIDTRRSRARKVLGRWVLTPLLFLVLGGALMAATVNIYIWLNKPERVYKDYSEDPAGFFLQQIRGNDAGSPRRASN
jgi:uncharacterized protein involved in exopolysaccharide biosynthesis